MKSKCKFFDAYKTNSNGVWFFVPDGEFKKGKPCKGFGCIKYSEGSVYMGDVYYDGDDYHKLGYGQQDFSKSEIGALDEFINEKKYKFVGKFDYRKNNWIYGNGVLYYTDSAGNPTHFVKGFFSWLDKIGDYAGEFDYSSLLDGYTADMEFDYDYSTLHRNNVFKEALEKSKTIDGIDVLFIGDSYFELMGDPDFCGERSFEKIFPDNCLNVGICGSTFFRWHTYITQLTGLKQPKKIIINLGFNDLHNAESAKKVGEDCKKLVKILNEMFPASSIYLVQVLHSPNHKEYSEAENELNRLTSAMSGKLKITVGDWNKLVKDSGKNCFHQDGVHPNADGYEIFYGFIKKLLEL